MNLKKLGLLGALGGALFFASCKDNPIAPPTDTPPSVVSFSAVHSSVEMQTPVLFTVSSKDAEGLDSVVVDFGDGARKSFLENRLKSHVDTASHAYSSAGYKAASACSCFGFKGNYFQMQKH